MFRFLIFPPLWAGLLVAAQFVWMVWKEFNVWLILHQPVTDVLFISQPMRFSWFVPAIGLGLATGLLFALLDFTLNRKNDPFGKETFERLLKSGGGSLSVALVLIVALGLLRFFVIPAPRRYHAYPAQMELLNLLNHIPLVFLGCAFLWTMFKSLRHR